MRVTPGEERALRVKRGIEGLPIPVDVDTCALSQFFVDAWPIWQMSDKLEDDGISINRVAIRPGWVKMEIDWHGGETAWGHAVDAEMILRIMGSRGEEHGLYFNRWQVKRPPGELWDQPLNKIAREAVLFFRTEKSGVRAVADSVSEAMMAEVNSNILANSFKMMEKYGIDDAD